jgi:ribosomal protein S18 acetylase RimI-like enzyme
MYKKLYINYKLCFCTKLGVFLLLFVIAFSNSALAFVDKTGEEIELVWDSKELLEKSGKVFIDAFCEAYKDISLEQLDLPDKDGGLEGFLRQRFEEEQNDAASGKISWVSAKKKDGTVVGYASFEINNSKEEVYLRQLAVTPEKKGKGIGKYLVFSIKERYHQVKKITLKVRLVNKNGLDFYERLGFQKSKNTYYEANSEKYMVLEITLEAMQESIPIEYSQLHNNISAMREDNSFLSPIPLWSVNSSSQEEALFSEQKLFEPNSGTSISHQLFLFIPNIYYGIAGSGYNHGLQIQNLEKYKR